MKNLFSQTPGNKLLFGISTAAHHVEGNNRYSDWWHFEKELTGGVSSGIACDSYRQYKRDRKILQQLNCSAYRFSIEWSRIEPKRGKFSQKAMDHYIEVIDDLRRAGIEPILTLHHFTNPLWFENSGGWENAEATFYFRRFVDFVLPRLGDKVRYFTPINEPNIFVFNKYLVKVWFPYKQNFRIAGLVFRNLAKAHCDAYEVIKKYQPGAFVGTCVQSLDIRAIPTVWWPINLTVAGVGNYLFNHLFYHLLNGKYDFVGLNFYSTYRVGFKGLIPTPHIDPHPLKNGKLRMESHPKRLLSTLRAVSRYGKPIIITENGKLTQNDAERAGYLRDVFEVMRSAISEGVSLLGYLHFTHIDSFEWGLGFGPKFGFFEHDRKTQKVSAKPSAKVYAELISKFVTWHKNNNAGVFNK